MEVTKDTFNMRQSKKESMNHWDMLVIGGGITGAGIALECQRLGLKVLLVERQDFAWGTSSKSSKMVHGGLRYLANGDVLTTLHSVKAREMMLRSAPGLVDLMRYMFPHYRSSFPGPRLFGLLLRAYDWMAGKRYRRFLSAEETVMSAPFLDNDRLIGATEFADAVTDDSRLVLRILQEFKSAGGVALNYTGVTAINQCDQLVEVVCQHSIDQYSPSTSKSYTAKTVVNATGAWANQLRPIAADHQTPIRPARGSHIVVPSDRLSVKHSLTLQSPVDKRPIFVYPWLGRTVVGTTDLDHGEVDNNEVGISAEELNYLLQLVDHFFPLAKLTEADVLTSWAGVRPLVASGAKQSSGETRDHSIWKDGSVATVSGGKLTTFLTIASDVIKKLADCYSAPLRAQLEQHQDPTTVRGYRLFPNLSEASWSALLVNLPSHIDKASRRRLVGYYGAALKNFDWHGKLSERISDSCYYWAELKWCVASESIVHLDDLLLRRLRLGLILPSGGMALSEDIQQVIQDDISWDSVRWEQEWRRYQTIWRKYYFLPNEISPTRYKPKSSERVD